MWDERYSAEEYVYGTAANDWLREKIKLPAQGKRALCLAEGEGRNAVYLATLGYDVLAVDQSAVGLSKAEQLAEKNGVSLKTHAANLADFDIEPAAFDLIVSIWAHVDPALRSRLHSNCVTGLKQGGAFVLEAYTPEQVGRGTGGPPDKKLTMNLEALHRELAGLEFEEAVEREREVQEGRFHNGLSSVVQVLARKK